MRLIREIIKVTIIFVLSFTIFTLLLLQPTHTLDFNASESGYLQPQYEIDWNDYKQSINSFVKDTIENRGLGTTKHRNQVSEEVRTYMTRSLYLIVITFIISLLLGIFKGIFDYRVGTSYKQIFGRWSTWILQSIPDFVLVISISWSLLLLMRMGFPRFNFYGHDGWSYMILPIIILSIYPTMYIAKIVSAKLSEQETLPYIQSAKAKGLSNTLILYKHLLGNCWMAICSHISSVMMFIISNLIIVEYLLFYQGGAYRLLQAIGYHHTKAPPVNNIEIGISIGLGLSFMLLLLASHIVSITAKYYLHKRG